MIKALVTSALFLSMLFLHNYYQNSEQQTLILKKGDDFNIFEQWSKFYGKNYVTFSEKLHRFKVWLDNREIIFSHNLGINQFTDMTNEEFNALYSSGHIHREGQLGVERIFEVPNADFPKSLDWRQKGAVSEVKFNLVDKGACGSCWAISTVGALEGTFALKTGNVTSLSTQQVVDCCRIDNYGCNGGDPRPAMDCLLRDGIMVETDYPYTGIASRICQWDPDFLAFTPTSYDLIKEQDPQQMLLAVNQAPVSICINSDSPMFQFYRKGVIQNKDCETDSTHCVLLVGYGTDEKGQDYWLVKNSWGIAWGDQGYFKLERDSKQGPGTCGVLLEGTLPKWDS